MRLFVPACGDRLVLTAPWQFTLFLEHRNIGFAKKAGLLEKDYRGYGVWEGDRYNQRLASRELELPAGTVLECSRVYIRQFNKSRLREDNDYDSITWTTPKVTGKEGRGRPFGRFWVKLSQACQIEFDPDQVSFYRDRVKLARQVMEG